MAAGAVNLAFSTAPPPTSVLQDAPPQLARLLLLSNGREHWCQMKLPVYLKQSLMRIITAICKGSVTRCSL